MDSIAAIERLSALAQESRLAVFRRLIRAGPEGLAAGEIAASLKIAPNTLSAQLNVLAQARLISSRRDGRSIIYMAEYASISDLIVYLMKDCCRGRGEVCGPIFDAAKAACRPQRRKETCR